MARVPQDQPPGRKPSPHGPLLLLDGRPPETGIQTIRRINIRMKQQPTPPGPSSLSNISSQLSRSTTSSPPPPLLLPLHPSPNFPNLPRYNPKAKANLLLQSLLSTSLAIGKEAQAQIQVLLDPRTPHGIKHGGVQPHGLPLRRLRSPRQKALRKVENHGSPLQSTWLFALSAPTSSVSTLNVEHVSTSPHPLLPIPPSPTSKCPCSPSPHLPAPTPATITSKSDHKLPPANSASTMPSGCGQRSPINLLLLMLFIQ